MEAVWAKERLSEDGVGLSICINSLRLAVVRKQWSIPNEKTSQTPFQQPQKIQITFRSPSFVWLYACTIGREQGLPLRRDADLLWCTAQSGCTFGLELVTERADGKCRRPSEEVNINSDFYRTTTKEATLLRRLGYSASTGV